MVNIIELNDGDYEFITEFRRDTALGAPDVSLEEALHQIITIIRTQLRIVRQTQSG